MLISEQSLYIENSKLEYQKCQNKDMKNTTCQYMQS